MGKSGGGGATQRESTLSKEQARIARELFERTAGLRGGLLGGAETKLGLPNTQGVPASDVALFGPLAPEREAVELGFNQAREGIISRTPARGGQLNAMLGDVEMERAMSLGSMEAAATQRAVDFGTGIAFQAPSQAMQGLGNAANQFGQIANRQAQEQAAKDQSLAGAGMMTGLLKVGMCWVAAAIYGDNSLRFRLARKWIAEDWEGISAKVVRRVYLTIGPRVARLVRKHQFLKPILKPIFNIAVKKELESIYG